MSKGVETLKFYLSYIKNIIHQNLAYRLNTIFKLVGNIIVLLIQYYLWQALLQENPGSSIYTFDEMVIFISVSMIMSVLLNNKIHAHLNEKIHQGSISMDLLKPLNLKIFYFFHSMSETLVNSIMSSVPLVIFAVIVFDVHVPSFFAFLIFIVFALCSILLNYFILFFLGIASFWMQQSWVLGRFYSSLILIFSGSKIPLSMYPPFLRSLSDILPFKWIYFIPISAFLGNIELTSVYRYLLMYALWIGVFTGLSNFLWKKGIKNIVINGG